MSVRTTEEIIALVAEKISGSTDETDLNLLEDVTDTVNDLASRINADGVDWKQKYEDNDKEWREKYINRFKNPAEKPPENESEDEPKRLTFENLFKEG